MTHSDAVALVRRLIDAAAHRDLAALMDCYAEDAVVHSPVFGEVRGRAPIADSWHTLFATFPEFGVDISNVLVDGDRIAVLSTVATTDRAGWFGRRPTGVPFGYRLVLLLTVADGRIVDDERIYDSVGVVERLEKARLDKELQTAADVQRALTPTAAHAGTFYRYVGESLPCRAIGGDFFDIATLPSRVVFIIGDVAGKGPAAALLAALLQGMFEADAADYGPAAVLTRMNGRLIARGLDASFATAVCAVLWADGRLVYSNAGHNPPVLVGGAPRRLTEGGPILGALRDASFGEETIGLEAGDSLILFTDGVTEACNDRDEEFGEARLLACIGDAARTDPLEVLARLFADVRRFCNGAEQSDDITVNVVRFT